MTAEAILEINKKLKETVFDQLKQRFVAKDEIIDLLEVSMIAGENLFILGPPGTAKSALVHELGRLLKGTTFDYLLTRFTEPNELFGPFDIRKLKEGDLVTNTEGMLPEADLVFLDELLNANSAILNSLLTALNERIFRRGRETRPLPALMFIGASNRLPEDDALNALFDRFLLRVMSNNVPDEEIKSVLSAGWKMEISEEVKSETSMDDIRKVHGLLKEINFDDVMDSYVECIHRLRHAGIDISDRRAVKLQKLIAASAISCGRLIAEESDLWVLRYIWNAEEQIEILHSIVDGFVNMTEKSPAAHPRSKKQDAPDPELLARDIAAIRENLSAKISESEIQYMKDRLSLLGERSEWVADTQQRDFLKTEIQSTWEKLLDVN
ncbi:MAG: AAA family ATPase [Lentisphaeria bacterium]|nr:AAA family ATPase [Lentisphaeria bacterium]NQZ67200.1 AAA family ATPase [Lentisphaeria bacterium]